MGTLVGGGNAFALTSYEQIYDYSPSVTLSNDKTTTSFSFNGITNSFVGAPTLTLALSSTSNFTDKLYLGIGETLLTTINKQDLNDNLFTYSFNTKALDKLNAAINNDSVSFTLSRNSGTSTITSATLKGTVAPEPASVALVAAGLVGLPFARRLRKGISKQS